MTFPVIFRSYKKKAASGPTTLILDEFTDTNGTALTAHTIAPTNVPATSWSEAITSGILQISSNQAMAVQPADANTFSIGTLNAGVADCVITATVTTANRTRTDYQAIISRLNSTSSYWLLGVSDGSDKIAILEATGLLTFTERASAAKVIAINTAYNLTVTLSGNVLTLDVDGTSCNYTSATNNTKTVHGFQTYARGGAGTKIDNFKVTTV